MERILADIHPDPIDRARRVSRGSARPAWTHLHRPLFALKSPCTGQTHARVIPGTLPTTKEREVLQLLAGGLSNKEIALALGIGEETVKWHLKNLFGKFDVGTRKHLLGRARVLGILDAVS
jgi:LuxR family maltose regulon positive regulatory protein